MPASNKQKITRSVSINKYKKKRNSVDKQINDIRSMQNRRSTVEGQSPPAAEWACRTRPAGETRTTAAVAWSRSVGFQEWGELHREIEAAAVVVVDAALVRAAVAGGDDGGAAVAVVDRRWSVSCYPSASCPAEVFPLLEHCSRSSTAC